jgi:hypothetical protein
MLSTTAKPNMKELTSNLNSLKNPKYDVIEVESQSDHSKINSILNSYKSNRKPFTLILVKPTQ